MKKLIFRLFFIAIFWFLLSVYVFPWSVYKIDVPFAGTDYRLWLDLQWWIELDYKVDLEEAKLDVDYNSSKEKEIIEWIKSIIDKRIETLNINDSVIASANYWWEQHIVVQLPLKWNNSLENSEKIEKAKEAIGRIVKIEFKEARNIITPEDIKARKELSNKALDELKSSKYDFFVTANKYKDSFENIKIWTMSWALNDIKKYFALENKLKIWIFNEVLIVKWKQEISFESWNIWLQDYEDGYWIINITDIKESSIEDIKKDSTLDSSSKVSKWQEIITFNYIFINQKPSEWKAAKDSKWRVLNDKYFVKSSVQYNDVFQPLIELTFNSQGAEIFWELTTRLTWKLIAIFVWWENLTAPRVNEPILSGRAVITWDYNVEEAKTLSQDINTWVVPAPIYLTSEKSIDSKLWLNSLEKLIIAWISGFLIILVFLLFVYRLSWIMASIALALYVVIILAIVKSFWVVLTLASIGWLILSIGIAIDSNILIFERVRDELKNGKNIDDATKVWFKKSWSAIWDSNITWLIVALVLFVFGINLIKWFGLMLIIWIVVSLFSCYFISRVLLLWLSKTSKNTKIFIWK